MEKIVLFLLLTSSLCYAQHTRKTYYGSVGIGISFINTNEINSVINFYNQTKTNLIKPMNTIGPLLGFNFLFGANFVKEDYYWNAEMGFYFNYISKKSSETLDGGVRKTTDILAKYPFFSLAGHYFIKASSSFDVGGGIGFAMGTLSVQYRSYPSAISPPAYISVNNANLFSDVGVTPDLVFNYNLSKTFTISARPFYYLMLTKQNATALNALLNVSSSPGNLNNIRYSGPGINLNFLFKLNAR